MILNESCRSLNELIHVKHLSQCSVDISNDYYFVSGTMLSPSYSGGTGASCQQQSVELDCLGSVPSSPLRQITSLCLSLPICKMGTITVLSSLWSYGQVSELIQRTAQSILVVLITFEYVSLISAWNILPSSSRDQLFLIL